MRTVNGRGKERFTLPIWLLPDTSIIRKALPEFALALNTTGDPLAPS
ncbi:MAG: hypothetical protein BWY83_02775 [bacterium ADurb.Bin478]|nr:MAG: hypothetical protein BWY83_02775 [bacterium ADurb.Bin478]